jgi:hypothetical protein
MKYKIFLNDEPYQMTPEDAPCLITYRDGTGGSQLSISLIADMFMHGEKVLFVTAFPPGKENFFEQTKGGEDKISYIETIEQLNRSARAMVLESGNEKLLLECIEKLSDIDERTIFIKNVETFGPEIFKKLLGRKNIILSGDIDRCADKGLITKNEFTTIIAFSQPETPLPIKVPDLQKYAAFFHGRDRDGIMRLVLED